MSERDDRRGCHWLAMMVGIGALIPVGLFALSFGEFMTINADHCRDPVDRPICSPATQDLVSHLPIWGTGAALLVGAGIGGFALWRRQTPIPWVLLAWVLLCGSVVVSCQVANAP